MAIGQNAIPPAVEDCRRQIDHLKVEIGILDRERATGAQPRRAARRVGRRSSKQAQARLAALETRWEDEKKLVEEIRALAQKIEARYAEEQVEARTANGQPFQPSAELAALQAELETKTTELRKLQGESPLMQVCVDSQTIAEVVAGWTGIPVGKMLADEIQTVLNLQAEAGGAGHRPVARPGGDRPADPDRRAPT